MAGEDGRPAWFKVFAYNKPVICAAPDEQVGAAVKAIMAYFETGELQELEPMATMIFHALKPGVDESIETYASSVENGRKGGRPKKGSKPTISEKKGSKPTLLNEKGIKGYQTQAEAEAEAYKEARERIDYDGIMDAYNTTCKSLPGIKSLSDARKKAIRARLNSYTQDDLMEAFRKAEASDFLRGANDRNWQANFDWILKDANIAKILDGNYDNKRKPGVSTNGKPIADDAGYDGKAADGLNWGNLL